MIDGRKALVEGTVLIDKLGNRYVLGKILGRGGSGLVYSAKKEGNALELAIKESFPFDSGIVRAEDGVTLCVNEDADELMRIVVESAERERIIGAAIIEENPNAEAIYEQLDICTVENPDETMVTNISHRFYLSVSLKGKAERLDELVKLQQEKMQMLDCIELFKECIAAIDMIHERGYVHLDISASNMYLFGCRLDEKKWGICKVIDFGNAKEIDEFGNVIWADRRSFHSPGFGAPELRRGQYSLVSQKTDIYSLGVLFYYILYSGRVLREGEKARIMGVRADKLGARYCLEMINHILLKATSVNVDERYETVSELMDAVESLEKEVKQPEELLAPIDVPRNFDNRGSEIQEFLGNLEKSSRFQIWGESGIGKTTFAAMLLERYKDEHPEARVFFVRYTGSIRDTFALLHSNKETDNDDYSLSSSAVKEERFRKNMDILGRCRKDDILYIDNFYFDSVGSIQELRVKEGEYYRQVEALPMKVVISTRYRGSKEGHLGPLSSEELDRTFFSELSEVSTEKRVRFYSLLDWNTYLIQLVLSSVELHPVTCPFDMLFQNLCEKSRNISEYEVYSEKDGTYCVAKYQALLETVWNVIALPEDEQTVLYLCAALIPEDGIKSDVFDKCIKRTEHITCFERLINKNWVIWDKDEKKYFLHDTARTLAKLYVDQADKVLDFLWEIAEYGDAEICAAIFAYVGINRRIKMGIYFYGVGNYKRGYHFFYNCLSMLLTTDEETICLALDGISKCIDKVQYFGNEDFLKLCEEQIVYGLNAWSGNLFGNNIVCGSDGQFLEDAYSRCICSLCNKWIIKYGYAEKEDWSEEKRIKYVSAYMNHARTRRTISVSWDISNATTLYPCWYEEEEFKDKYIEERGGKYSRCSLELLGLIWDEVAIEKDEDIFSSDRNERMAQKLNYRLKVIHEFNEHYLSSFIQKDSLMGLIVFTSSAIMSALVGLTDTEETAIIIEPLIREIEAVDSVLMQEVYLYYGIFLAHRGLWTKALKYYEKSIDRLFYEPNLDKRRDELLFRKMSEAYFALGQMENAVYYQMLGLSMYIESCAEHQVVELKDYRNPGVEAIENLRTVYSICEGYVQKYEYEKAYHKGKYCDMHATEEYSLLFDEQSLRVWYYRKLAKAYKKMNKDIICMNCEKYEGLVLDKFRNKHTNIEYVVWMQPQQFSMKGADITLPGWFISEVSKINSDGEYEVLDIRTVSEAEKDVLDRFYERWSEGNMIYSLIDSVVAKSTELRGKL